jgi:hypothetical protein
MRINFSAALLACGLMVGASAQAAMVGSFANPVVLEDFDQLGFVSTGPITLAGGQIIATSNVLATYDALPVDLGSNGAWGVDGYVGIGDFYQFSTTPSATDSLTFTSLAGLSSLGAEFNIYKDELSGGNFLLEALGVNGAVLESAQVSIGFNDPAAFNQSAFYGFTRASNDIFALRITGDGFVADNLMTSAVPVPASLPLFLSGMAVFYALRRRKKA